MKRSIHLDESLICLWTVGLDAGEDTTSAFETLLRPDEIQRANSFRFGHLRKRFVVARGSLRLVLASYLDQSPDAFEFEYGTFGKPSLCSGSDLAFNVSHSRTLAAIAISRGCQVGVDVEEIRPIANVDGIAQQAFSESDYGELAARDPSERQGAFFRCWTRKEALAKATGAGLFSRWGSASVGVMAESKLCVCGGPCEIDDREWTVTSVDVDSSYAAALAFEGSLREIRQLPTLSAMELLRMQERFVQRHL